jgi:hypothetical protein
MLEVFFFSGFFFFFHCCFFANRFLAIFNS